ncbi:MAG: CsbD family protein [Planctomycetota bacterium]|nr:CsbD family protein [Planctomycetota bacterium]
MEEVQGTWNQMAGAVKNKYAQITGDDLASVNGNIQKLAGVIQKKTGKAREEIEEFLRSASTTTSTTVERISEAASDMATKASETLRDGYDYAREASRDGIKNATETVQHRPGEAVLLAMGIGLVRSKVEKSIKGSVAIGAGNPLVAIDGTAIPEEPLPTNVAESSPGALLKPSVAERSASTVGGWRLIDGQRIQGEFMGFDLKPLSIKRASSEVYVGGVLFSQLDPVYKHILPMTIAHLENAKIDDVRDIEKWLIKSGPGPWIYKLETVMIETPNRGSVAIPTFLLDKSVFDAIAVPSCIGSPHRPSR